MPIPSRGRAVIKWKIYAGFSPCTKFYKPDRDFQIGLDFVSTLLRKITENDGNLCNPKMSEKRHKLMIYLGGETEARPARLELATF